MRKKLIDALATKFVGVDAKILGRIADDILSGKTIESEEDINSAVEGVDFAKVLKSYGDSRATEATKTAVSNYEKKYGLKEGRKVEDGDNDDNGDAPDDGKKKKSSQKNEPDDNNRQDNQNDGQMAELLNSIKALATKFDSVSEELNSLKKNEVVKSRRARLDDVIKDLRPSQKKAYERYSLDGYTDEEFTNLLDELTEEVSEITKDNNAIGGTFSSPLSQMHEPNDKVATDAEVQEVLDSIKL